MWGGTGRRPSEAAQIAPEERCRENAARSGWARRGQRSKGILLAAAGLRAEPRAPPTAAAPRWRSGEGEPRLPAGLRGFSPALLPRPERRGFGCPLRQKQKPLRGAESGRRGGRRGGFNLCPFSPPPELDAGRGSPRASRGPPHAEGDSAARPASAFKSVTMRSNRCPIKKRGSEVSPPSPYIERVTTATSSLSLTGFLDQIKKYFLKAARGKRGKERLRTERLEAAKRPRIGSAGAAGWVRVGAGGCGRAATLTGGRLRSSRGALACGRGAGGGGEGLGLTEGTGKRRFKGSGGSPNPELSSPVSIQSGFAVGINIPDRRQLPAIKGRPDQR